MKTKSSIDRRKFCKMSAIAAAATGTALLTLNAGSYSLEQIPASDKNGTDGENTKDIFKKCGACSHTFFYIMNREFKHPKLDEEKASDPLAGGMMQGHQCGMLWGAALGAGAESFRRNSDINQAMASAIGATRSALTSFCKRTGTPLCSEITGVNIKSKLGIFKMMVKIVLQGGMKNSRCFRLADKWAPEAINSVKNGLSYQPVNIPQPCLNCAAEVVKRKGGTAEEMVMVSGFAGGMGLSGYACGALAAAIWMDTLKWCRKNPGKSSFEVSKTITNPLLERFFAASGKKINCDKITGTTFYSLKEHSGYIANGGCEQIISALA